MKALAALLRLAAGCCLLYLSGIVFYQPLADAMPGELSRSLERIPGVGASGGFMAQILSEPPGAAVAIDGKPRGTAPFFGNVACREGEKVRLEVRAEGFETWSRTVECRPGGSLKATARLKPPAR